MIYKLKDSSLFLTKQHDLSHGRERKEKDCLNCGTLVQGRFCQQCGQENISADLSVGGLIAHFLYDITHFDGRFFSTVKILFKRPGFLSKAFIEGRRAAYLDPARMYIFTSAIFFLLFYTFFFRFSEKNFVRNYKHASELIDKLVLLDSTAEFDYKNYSYILRNKKDTIVNLRNAGEVQTVLDSLNRLLAERHLTSGNEEGRKGIGAIASRYRSLTHYDSLQVSLPDSLRHSFVKRLIMRRIVSVNEEYQGDLGAFFGHLVNRFIHSFPTILFISLPLLAFLQKLNYIRHRNILVAHHGIFLIHLFIFIFIWMTIYFSLRSLADLLNINWFFIFSIGLFAWLFIYIYKAMRSFYQQRKVKTGLHWLVFLGSGLLILLIVFGIYFTFVALKG